MRPNQPTEAQQQKNIDAVKGVEVRVVFPDTGKQSRKTARIVGYHSPLVWELDTEIYGTRYHHDRYIRTLQGKQLAQLV